MARAGVLCLVLLAYIGLGSCTRCYQCTSQNDPACADPFTSSKSLQDCSRVDIVNFNRNYLSYLNPDLASVIPGSTRYCHKIVLQTGTVVRSCFDGNPSNLNATCMYLDASARQWPNDKSKQLKHCSACDRDECNAAGTSVASLSLALGAAFLAYCFRQ